MQNGITLLTKISRKLYLVFITPIFEYASEVWDNCGIGHSNNFETLKLKAARIVTGLPIFNKPETFLNFDL